MALCVAKPEKRGRDGGRKRFGSAKYANLANGRAGRWENQSDAIGRLLLPPVERANHTERVFYTGYWSFRFRVFHVFRG